jgi:hypothetical protein
MRAQPAFMVSGMLHGSDYDKQGAYHVMRYPAHGFRIVTLALHHSLNSGVSSYLPGPFNLQRVETNITFPRC